MEKSIQRKPSSHADRVIPALAVVIGLILCFGCGSGEGDDGTRVPITVMTRNLYLGANLEGVIFATDLEQLYTRVEAFRSMMEQSDIPARIELIADEIVAAAPDLVALQEVELFRIQEPSDLDPAAPLRNAEAVLFDMLTLLQSALLRRGAEYDVAVINTLSDVEAPGRRGQVLYDLRMTDRDVTLVKRGRAFSRPVAAHFVRYVELQLGGIPGYSVQIRRGWTSIDVAWAGTTLLFVNTHLEVGGPLLAFQREQGSELVRALRSRTEQIIMAGDFNSPAPGGDTYRDLTRSYVDAWTRLPAPIPTGNTCCRSLEGPAIGENGERIDLVLTRGGPITTISGVTVGERARTPSGLAASDHAGVVMTLGIRPAASS